MIITNLREITKRYSIIYIDPPWNYKDKGCNGNCNQYYNTLTLEDLKLFPIPEIADTNSVLFIWITYPMIPEGLELIKSWGFIYKTIGFQWIKENKHNKQFFIGTGHWTRSNSEACFIATKGKISALNHNIHQIIKSPITKHSEKPTIIYKKIVELMGDIPRIEIFARKEVYGWDCFGNQIKTNINKLGGKNH